MTQSLKAAPETPGTPGTPETPGTPGHRVKMFKIYYYHCTFACKASELKNAPDVREKPEIRENF